MSTSPRIWKTRHNGTEYGPYTDSEMAAFIDQRRVNAETEVQHRGFTQDHWRKAVEIQPLRDRISPPIATHSRAEVSPRMVEIAQAMKQRPSRRSQRRVSPMLPLALAAMASVAVCVTAFFWFTDKPAGILPNESPEQRLIRAYLKQETPTGTWEEIGWSQDVVYRRPVTRLDFRTENPFGGQTKAFLCAKYYHDSETVFMAGWGIDFELWADPTKYGLPAVHLSQ